ncbi:hypothetical protein ACFVRD_49015 [Streptomyces sp. NPDC057908]|uniref:hypothetical protein n=1 Tax=Streptomyces sp. NPDC057908 TaxID=3346276 RepID=UPI0036E3F0E6
MWEQAIGTFPVAFTEDGDEWAYHLKNAMGGSGFQRISGTDGAGGPVAMGPPLDGSMTSILRVRPHADGITCTVVGEDGTLSPAQIDPWRAGAHTAVGEIGRHQKPHAWDALVGLSPSTILGPDLRGQLSGRNLGPLDLAASGVYMREFRGPERVDSHFTGISRTFPVVVTGRVTTYHWDRVVPVAQAQLRRVCALLTLSRKQLWEPRTHPWPQTAAGSTLKIPISVGPEFPSPEGQEWTGEVPPGTAGWRLPWWVDQAWERLENDSGLSTALNAYYEAMRLHRRHPSLALLTYVAAIEGVGMRFIPDALCDCHPECTHYKGVAEKRFRKALKTVLTQREVKELAGPLYDKRSHTGHRGTLFGSEEVFGYAPTGPFQTSPYFQFEAMMLGQLAMVTNAVLVKAFSDPDRGPGG